ncbi:MAG: hypothetical protein KME17_26260 [Cyanosarcina radialis HA8281-LM2]|nr:hypothetical protein [Cyanosarcina radialis HA8281-LM2]
MRSSLLQTISPAFGLYHLTMLISPAVGDSSKANLAVIALLNTNIFPIDRELAKENKLFGSGDFGSMKPCL